MTQTDQAAEPVAQASGDGRTVDLEAVKARWERVDGCFDHHVATAYPTHCDTCVQRWPCDEAEARESLADVPALVAEVKALRTQLAEARGLGLAIAFNLRNCHEVGKRGACVHLTEANRDAAALAALKEQAR